MKLLTRTRKLTEIPDELIPKQVVTCRAVFIDGESARIIDKWTGDVPPGYLWDTRKGPTALLVRDRQGALEGTNLPRLSPGSEWGFYTRQVAFPQGEQPETEAEAVRDEGDESDFLKRAMKLQWTRHKRHTPEYLYHILRLESARRLVERARLKDLIKNTQRATFWLAISLAIATVIMFIARAGSS